MKALQGRIGARAIDQLPEKEGEHGELVVQFSDPGIRRLKWRIGSRKDSGTQVADVDHQKVGSIVVK